MGLLRRARSFAIVLCCVLFAGGCELTPRQKAAAQKFGAATADLADLASAEFRASREDYLAMRAMRTELKDPADEQQYFRPHQVQERVEALVALREYGELLTTLVSSSSSAQLQASADSFVSSLRQVKGVSLSDESASTISRVVQFGGSLIVEHKRAQALRKVVALAHPSVNQLVDLVKRDFDPEDDHWELGYSAAVTALDGAAALAEAQLRASSTTSPASGARTVGLADEALIERAKLMATRNQERFSEIGPRILEAADALRQAQTDLRAVVHSDELSPDDIDAYVARITSFIEFYKTLRPNAAK